MANIKKERKLARNFHIPLSSDSHHTASLAIHKSLAFAIGSPDQVVSYFKIGLFIVRFRREREHVSNIFSFRLKIAYYSASADLFAAV